MKFFKYDKKFKLQLIVTGSHLSKKHGLTYKEILKDKYKIDKKINLDLNNDKSEDNCKAMGTAIIEFSKAYKKLKPDIIVLLGDRYEIFSACSAAHVHQILVCHLHGGELTRGSMDDSFRHSITKMAHLHFVANKKYYKRVKQLGENPKNIYFVGGFGTDLIKKIKLFNKKKLEKELRIKFAKKNILVTYHPETIKGANTKNDFQKILNALKKLKNTKIIFTKANADKNGIIINSMIEKFVNNYNSKSYFFSSMGYKKYLSTLKYVDGVLGNSSSGLLEVPSFKKATINIGERQKDRLKAKSVIDVMPETSNIEHALKRIYSKKFKNILKKTFNLYGNGGSSDKTYNIIKNINLENYTKKKFFDIN